MSAPGARAIGIGVVGLGRAFTLMLPTFVADPRVRLVAGFDPLAPARERFAADFGAAACADVESVCRRPDVELVYVASPHEHHAEHARIALDAGRHVMVEKPMALTRDACEAMIDAARRAGRHLIVGHSHSFDRPVQRVRELVEARRYGDVRMVTALNYTDFLYRPRRPEELDSARGGGVVFSQGAHQIDVVRLIAGGEVTGVSAATGAWDPSRPAEGAYSALLRFRGGAFAHVTYSGYAHYDSDELTDGIGELGQPKSPADYGAARRRLAASSLDEAALKAARNYGGSAWQAPAAASPAAWQHFGFLVVSCDRADLRPTPTGVVVYGDDERRFEPIAPPPHPRIEVIDELWAAVRDDRAPRHDGVWARDTLRVCLAILASARGRREVAP